MLHPSEMNGLALQGLPRSGDDTKAFYSWNGIVFATEDELLYAFDRGGFNHISYMRRTSDELQEKHYSFCKEELL